MLLESDGSDPSLLTDTARETQQHMMLLERLPTDTGLTQVCRLTQRERHRICLPFVCNSASTCLISTSLISTSLILSLPRFKKKSSERGEREGGRERET
jgi:hypothetical protein